VFAGVAYTVTVYARVVIASGSRFVTVGISGGSASAPVAFPLFAGAPLQILRVSFIPSADYIRSSSLTISYTGAGVVLDNISICQVGICKCL